MAGSSQFTRLLVVLLLALAFGAGASAAEKKKGGDFGVDLLIDKAGGIGIFVKNTVEDLSGDGSWIERIIG